tara:strand:- start:417 stop:602 length:186 start_codon:yes stop_codon:yes gene_type:complete
MEGPLKKLEQEWLRRHGTKKRGADDLINLQMDFSVSRYLAEELKEHMEDAFIFWKDYHNLD